MTEIAVAVFVKTPGFSPLKTRLAAGIGEAAALEFYRRSLRAIEELLQSAVSEDPRLIPYWAVAEEAAVKESLWSAFPCVPQGAGALGDRLARVHARLREEAGSVIFLGADSPQLSVPLLRQAAEAIARVQQVLGPALDGGFYLFGSAAELPASLWRGIQYSAPTTGAELARAVAPWGVPVELPCLTDVDEARDLPVFVKQLASLERKLPAQEALLEWMTQLAQARELVGY